MQTFPISVIRHKPYGGRYENGQQKLKNSFCNKKKSLYRWNIFGVAHLETVFFHFNRLHQWFKPIKKYVNRIFYQLIRSLLSSIDKNASIYDSYFDEIISLVGSNTKGVFISVDVTVLFGTKLAYFWNVSIFFNK